MFIARSPLFLAYLGGILVAVMAWQRRPQAARLVTIGLSLMAVLDLGLMFVGHELISGMGYLPFALLSGVLHAAALGLVIAAAFQGPAGVAAAPNGSAPWSGPQASPAALRPPTARRISKGFYFGGIIGGTVLSVLAVAFLLVIAAEGRGRDREAAAFLMLPALLPALAAVVLHFCLVYRLWDALRGGGARTTPGAAVGLLFVPLFNLYWIFQAYWGWTQDYNRLRETRGLRGLPRAPEGLALTCCLFAVLAVIPFIGPVLALVNVILMLIFLSHAIDCLNALAGAGQGTYPANDVPSWINNAEQAAWAANRAASQQTQPAHGGYSR
jgi:hypothetical protein